MYKTTFLYCKGSLAELSVLNILFSNSVETEEISYYVALHVSLQCMQKYLIVGIQNKNLIGNSLISEV